MKGSGMMLVNERCAYSINCEKLISGWILAVESNLLMATFNRLLVTW
jgi:hypothetical protein